MYLRDTFTLRVDSFHNSDPLNHLNKISDTQTTVWPENLTGIKFDEIASKLHNKNMTDFNLTK